MMGLLIFKQAIGAAFTIYSMMILVRILSSWFPQAQGHPLMQLLGRLTDPYLAIFRRFIPRLGMIDLSPMVAMFALYGLEYMVYQIIP